MKNCKRKKGNQAELWVQKFLEKQGWIIHRARQSYYQVGNKIFTRSNDIFNCFDLIAKKSDEPTRWIQVAVGYKKSHKLKKFKQIVPKIVGCGDVFELWLKTKSSEWKIYEFDLKKNDFVEIGKIERGKFYVNYPTLKGRACR